MPALYFDFPYHTTGDDYPDSSLNIKMGRGYSFASAPKGPDQLALTLSFDALFWWQDEYRLISRTVQPQLNVATLQDFYESVRMFTPFTYPHPSRGDLTCRFSKPLARFKMAKGHWTADTDSGLRGHQVEPFELSLVSLP